MTLGEKIQKLRKEKQMSQEDLAEKLKVSRQTISRWEQDQALPDLSNIIALGKIFSVSIDDLVQTDLENLKDNKDTIGLAKDLYSYKMKVTFGIILITIGIIMAIGLSIYGSIDGGHVYSDNGPSLNGLPAFLYIHELYWVYFLAAALALIGLGLTGILNKLGVFGETDKEEK